MKKLEKYWMKKIFDNLIAGLLIVAFLSLIFFLKSC